MKVLWPHSKGLFSFSIASDRRKVLFGLGISALIIAILSLAQQTKQVRASELILLERSCPPNFEIYGYSWLTDDILFGVELEQNLLKPVAYDVSTEAWSRYENVTELLDHDWGQQFSTATSWTVSPHSGMVAFCVKSATNSIIYIFDAHNPEEIVRIIPKVVPVQVFVGKDSSEFAYSFYENGRLMLQFVTSEQEDINNSAIVQAPNWSPMGFDSSGCFRIVTLTFDSNTEIFSIQSQHQESANKCIQLSKIVVPDDNEIMSMDLGKTGDVMLVNRRPSVWSWRLNREFPYVRMKEAYRKEIMIASTESEVFHVIKLQRNVSGHGKGFSLYHQTRAFSYISNATITVSRWQGN